MSNLFSNSAGEGADDGAKRHGVIQLFGIEEFIPICQGRLYQQREWPWT